MIARSALLRAQRRSTPFCRSSTLHVTISWGVSAAIPPHAFQSIRKIFLFFLDSTRFHPARLLVVGRFHPHARVECGRTPRPPAFHPASTPCQPLAYGSWLSDSTPARGWNAVEFGAVHQTAHHFTSSLAVSRFLLRLAHPRHHHPPVRPLAARLSSFHPCHRAPHAPIADVLAFFARIHA